MSTLSWSRMWNLTWTLLMIHSRLEEAPSTVWSSGTVSSRPWRAALGRNAPAPASMGRRPRIHQRWGRSRVSWVHRASTQWWPFLWYHLRSNRPSTVSSTSLRTWGVATRPKRWVIIFTDWQWECNTDVQEPLMFIVLQRIHVYKYTFQHFGCLLSVRLLSWVCPQTKTYCFIKGNP